MIFVANLCFFLTFQGQEGILPGPSGNPEVHTPMELHGDMGQKERGRQGEFLGAFAFGASSFSAMTRSKCAEVEQQPDAGVE